MIPANRLEIPWIPGKVAVAFVGSMMSLSAAMNVHLIETIPFSSPGAYVYTRCDFNYYQSCCAHSDDHPSENDRENGRHYQLTTGVGFLLHISTTTRTAWALTRK